jgi:hypothetical protein
MSVVELVFEGSLCIRSKGVYDVPNFAHKLGSGGIRKLCQLDHSHQSCAYFEKL